MKDHHSIDLAGVVGAEVLFDSPAEKYEEKKKNRIAC